jgi:GH24 family phage-related lysozyme (muramidase)
MKYINAFDEQITEKLIEQLINDEFLLENINFNNIDINKLFNNTVNKLKNTKNIIKRKQILNILFVLYLLSSGLYNNKNFWTTDADKIKDNKISTLGINNNLSKNEIIANFNDIKNQINNNKYNNDILKNPLSLTSSKYIQEFIKNHEKLRLSAYNIGDGMITIGYGHAEPIKRSKYKIGDEITINEAEKLFKHDLSVAENGVRRIFKQWQEDGININVSQNMYDSMVSMAFNMGVSGFRQSKFIQKLKNTSNHIDAAALILTSRNSGKFSGLNNRREQEANLFLKDYINSET